MSFVTALITLSIILVVALLVNRIASVALTFTGLSREMARFQARSAFSTVGFTTTESESVVNHPVRRRIISVLMLMGNVGYIGIISTIVSSFSNSSSDMNLAQRFVILIGMLILLWAIGTSKWVDTKLSRSIGWALKRWTHLEVHDFQNLLHLSEGYIVTELKMTSADWVVGHRLDELRLADVGVIVLGIHRGDGEFVGSPVGSTYVRANDCMVIYGAREAIIALEKNKSEPDMAKKHRKLLAEIRAHRKEEDKEQGEGYTVTEIALHEGDWLTERPLSELRLGDVGINVLGVYHADGAYVGSPTGATMLHVEDTLVVYGLRDDILALDEARSDADSEEFFREQAAQRRASQVRRPRA